MAEFFATLTAQTLIRSFVFLVYLAGCILSIVGFSLMRLHVSQVRLHDLSVYSIYLIVIILGILHFIAFMIWLYTKRPWLWKFKLLMNLITMYFVGAVSYHAAVDYKQRLCQESYSFELRVPPGTSGFCKGKLLMMIGTLMLGVGYIVFPFTVLPLGTHESYVQISGGASQA